MNIEQKETHTTETKIEEKNGLFFGAKTLSKIAMIFATFYLILLPLLKDYFKINLNIDDIIKISLTIMILWSPTYASIYVDKFIGSKK